MIGTWRNIGVILSLLITCHFNANFWKLIFHLNFNTLNYQISVNWCDNERISCQSFRVLPAKRKWTAWIWFHLGKQYFTIRTQSKWLKRTNHIIFEWKRPTITINNNMMNWSCFENVFRLMMKNNGAHWLLNPCYKNGVFSLHCIYQSDISIPYIIGCRKIIRGRIMGSTPLYCSFQLLICNGNV